MLLAAKCCGQCLTTRNRIVSGARAAEIIRTCRAERNHFFCHKGTVLGLQVHCHGVHSRYGSVTASVAEALGVPVRLVDADQLEQAPLG